MKVCQIVTGIIPVPNNRWGAVEKVIWNYKKALNSRGIECDVKYLNEVNEGDYDIVHIHMANLCLEAQKKRIDYVFSIHDHHTEYHGRDSFIYNQNLKAMKGSVFSITHAPHYLDLFDEVDKLFYLPHGVDTEYFTPRKENIPPSILMVANNGLAGDYAIDRKGFELGINAAKELSIPITIIGAEANKRFFALKPHLLEYERLRVIDDNPTDDIVLRHYQNNSIFLHPSFIEAGHPNLTLLEAASCCLNVVATYRGKMHIEGMQVIEELSHDNIVDKIKCAWQNAESYTKMIANRKKYDWEYVVKQLSCMYESVINIENEYTTDEITQSLLTIYKK